MADLENLLQSSGRSSSVLGAIANPAQVNVLGAYGAAADTAGKIYGVQDLQSQKAWGEALQQSTGPDGVTDYQKASAIAAQNPLAAMGMMKGLTGSTALSGAVQTQGTARNQMLTDAMSSALNAPDDQLHDAVVAGTQKLVASGALTQEQAHRALLNMPSDPAQLRTQMERNRISLLPPGMQQPAIYGAKGTTTDANGNIIGTSQSLQSGAVTQAQPTGTGPYQGMSPEQRNTIVQVPYPQFLEDGKTPNPNWGRTFPMKAGDLIPILPTTPPGQGGGVPASLRPKPAAGGQPAPNAQPAPAPGGQPSAQPAAAPAAPAAPATPATSVGTGPSPADIEQQKADAANNAATFQDISNRAVASRDRSSILGNMLGDTTQFSTGALSKITGNLRNVAISLGMPGINVEGQSAKESFNKLAAQLAQAQGAGAPSDARQAMAVSANPHEELSPAGADLMIRQLQGNEDYLQARAKLAGSGDQRDIKKFENETGVKLDPRAFQFARMKEGSQRKTWFNSLSKTDQAKVTQSYNFAHDQGLVSGP